MQQGHAPTEALSKQRRAVPTHTMPHKAATTNQTQEETEKMMTKKRTQQNLPRLKKTTQPQIALAYQANSKTWRQRAQQFPKHKCPECNTTNRSTRPHNHESDATIAQEANFQIPLTRTTVEPKTATLPTANKFLKKKKNKKNFSNNNLGLNEPNQI
jgi:hypothetical protein